LALAGAAACVIAAITACSSSGSSGSASSSGSHKGSAAASVSPNQAVLLAARSAEKINSYSGTFTLRGTVKKAGASGPIDVAGTVSGQRQPSLLVSENFTTFNAGGQNLAPMGEVITSKNLYMKMKLLTQALHTSKPWVELPVSAISAKSGINFGSLLNEARSSSPLTSVQLLAGASDVKKVGTGTVGGVPVTEYSGTTTIATALSKLPADTRAGLQKAISATGIKTATFNVWLDSGNQARKTIVTENGTALSDTITTTLTSVNQPVTVTPPPASQTTVVPASALNGS
jgi:hypothetical protein